MSFARMALFLCLISACNSEPQLPAELGGVDQGQGENPRHRRDERVASITLDEVPPEITGWPKVAVRGRGPVTGKICYWETTRMRTMDAEIGADGRFCIDLKLVKQRRNVFFLQSCGDRNSQRHTVTVTHVDKSGGTNEASQSPEAPPVESVAVPKNLLFQSAATTNLKSGTALDALSDESDRGAVRLLGHPEEPDWIRFPLSERQPIHEIEVTTAGACPATGYTVFTSDSAGDPGAPSWNAQWTVAAEVTGARERETIAVVGHPSATHVGIVFQNSACATTAGQFDVAEVRAITYEQSKAAPIAAPEIMPATLPGPEEEPELCGANGVP